MKIYLSIVSHGHGELIGKINSLSNFFEDENIVIVIKNNCHDAFLLSYASRTKIHLLDFKYGLGFGANNNIVFSYCKKKLGMIDEDIFIVINPDVDIELFELKKLALNMVEDKVSIAAINLFKNKEKSIFDNSIRKFPSLYDFFKSFLGFKNDSIIDKKVVLSPVYVDWSAGSFIAFRSDHYMMLGGFDENYFMYCEDIDICYRSFKLKKMTMYYPSIHAVHFAEHANRKIFSRHFLWHIKSVFRYLLSRNDIVSMKSSL